MTKSTQTTYIHRILVVITSSILIGFAACKKSDGPGRPQKTKLLTEVYEVVPETGESLHVNSFKYDTLKRMIGYTDWQAYNSDIVGADPTKRHVEEGRFKYTATGQLASIDVYYDGALTGTQTFRYTDGLIEQFENVKDSANPVVTTRYHFASGNLNRIEMRNYGHQYTESVSYTVNQADASVFNRYSFFQKQNAIVDSTSLMFDIKQGAFSCVAIKEPVWWFWAKYSSNYLIYLNFSNLDHNLTGIRRYVRYVPGSESEVYNSTDSYDFQYKYDEDGFPVSSTTVLKGKAVDGFAYYYAE